MDQASLHATEARCTQEHMPKCQSSCPLHMDVRAFMGHMADGKHNEARKIIERHIPLPNIFTHICDHPCENSCLRRDLGGSLAIQSLESLCMEKTQKQGKGFLRPAKAQKVAVLGSGLAGFVVAYELAKKSWPVTIFYQAHEAQQEGAHVGDFLQQHFPQLSQEQIQEECDQLTRQHATFVAADLTTDFFAQLDASFAAVFVDAHAAPEIFASLNAQPDAQTGHVKDHICAGGMLQHSPTGSTYASSSAQAGQGRQAALSIERLLGGIAPSAGREAFRANASLHTPLEGVRIAQAHYPASGTYSPEEAQAEAARCIQCQCMQCVKKCVYLQKYGSFPRSYTRQIYNNAAIVQGERRANSLVNGCMLCGQCTEICPERFSMAEVCLQAREDLVTRGHMPASAHAFALEDMGAATQAPATFFMEAAQKTNKEGHFAFFPGCQLAASRGNQVLQTYAFLRKHLHDGVGLMLSCCGTPAQWAGQKNVAAETAQHLATQWEQLGKPTLIVACASCKKFFAEILPHIPCTSLWEVLYTLREHIPTKKSAPIYTLHDPCSARNDTAWLDATRLLAQHCGVNCEDSANSKKHTACCGYGGLVWCAQPELAAQATQQVAKDLGEHTGLASCSMCRDRLVNSQKPCVHLLDILPFITQDAHISATQPAPSLSARRANRVRLVQECRELYSTENILHSEEKAFFAALATEYTEGHHFLHIAPELLAELERKYILHQDAAAAVLAVEKHKKRFLEKESGHYVGAWRSGHVTFWVRYAQDATGQYHLYDAWCHRMRVPNITVEEA